MNMEYINDRKKFFNSVSLFYDDMISFQSSLKNRITFYGKLLAHKIKFAADIGCGTGLDSIALCRNGLKVTAFDISPCMIKSAKKNASKHKCKIDFVCSSVDKISKNYFGNFDLVVSMGNTIANLSPLLLGKTIRIIHDMLKKGGTIIIQVLNFDKIIKDNKRIIKISKIPGEYIVRFYDIHEHYLNFNILKFNSSKTNEYDLKTTYLYPYTKLDMEKIFHKAGFRRIKSFGNLQLDKFSSKKSIDLIISSNK